MRSFKRALRWALLVLLLLLVGGVGASWLVNFRQTDEELTEEFQGQRIRPTIHRYRVPTRANDPDAAWRTIRFIETPADDSLPVVIFVHGAPSSLSFFNKFFKDTTLLNRARLVAVDRPGYGYSDFGWVETSIIRQAKFLQPLIERYRNAPYLMLVGSSYGGSVSARLAMNNPNLVDHVVFVSSALGPGLEYTYPISYYLDKPPLRWLIPPLLRLANDEKLSHRRALEAILPDWPKIKAGITMLHGQRDELVYPTNVTFAQEHLVNAKVKQFLLPENRHDIVLYKREYMTEILLDILTRRDVKEQVKTNSLAVQP
ncbi:hydrolase or acyltransferase (alpha/beta hydrolase superfamily)-like protein [Fibrisoma limi BUZ 3]|uniref:Hydrolase or acyltransferase (Alpha/beta hydrolase superfamily)-like protein n=1 Tax=Fibrisoma limi BUZ 3 TaxID=1185876 RepID=I2GNU0_9BACT|nr:alpha/beta hydrolase [Fibrisoma limi]CCH55568.1 hydrolase or acyltransferase (alpha/beta hydrolase superfamily)-like protein [Fibrisoma limi BUZ 3]